MKYLISVVIAFSLCVGVAKSQNGKFVLDVKTNAVNQKLLIIDKDGRVDSVISTDGRFRKEGTVSVPYKTSLFLIDKDQSTHGISIKRGGFPIYIEPGVITVTSAEDKLAGSVLGGTPLNKDLYEYNELRGPYLQKLNQLENDYRQSQKDRNPIQSKIILDEYNALEQKLKEAEIGFFNSHLNSMVSLGWLRSYLSSPKKKVEVTALFVKMGNDVKQSKEGKEFAAKLEKMQVIELNAMAPDFTVKNTKGEDVSLKSYRGKYVLVDFWASWCGPCRQENPNVLAAYNAFKDNNFTVLGVSLDSSKGAWEKAVEKDGLPWEQVSDLKGWNSAPADLYGIRSIPSSFLINPDGRIVGINLRGEELHKKLGELFGK